MIEQEIVEFIAKSIVLDPDSVETSVVEGERSTIIELRVAPDDIGRIIGRSGRTTRAIQTLIGAASKRSGKRVMLEILD